MRAEDAVSFSQPRLCLLDHLVSIQQLLDAVGGIIARTPTSTPQYQAPGKQLKYGWRFGKDCATKMDIIAPALKTVNGTIPGPAIVADWGDDLFVHVVNTMKSDGTSMHWHGVRQLGSPEFDGVPGVSQCPMSPGVNMTYRFKATQYGTGWYHSHFSLQTADGTFGS